MSPDEIENRLNAKLGENKDDSHIDDWFELEDAGEDTVNLASPLDLEDADELDLGPLSVNTEPDPDGEAEAVAKAAAELIESEAEGEPEGELTLETEDEDISAEGEDDISEEAEDLFPELSGKRPNAKASDAQKGASSKSAAGEKEEDDSSEDEKPKEPGKVLRVKGMGRDNDLEGTFPWRGWAVVIGLILLAIALVNSPIFSLKTYEVEGNERISDEDVLRDLDLYEGINLFRYAMKHINSTPHVDSRLSTVDVYFEWPSHVHIVVEESQTIGYIYFQGTYLCIDRKGQVANSTNTPDQDLPLIKGISVGSFSIGESLSTSDAERYDAVVTIGSTLRKYEMQGIITEINVHNLDDIILLSPKLECRCGNMTDIGQKIAVFAQLIERSNVPSGILHIESLNNEIYIEPFEETETKK